MHRYVCACKLGYVCACKLGYVCACKLGYECVADAWVGGCIPIFMKLLTYYCDNALIICVKYYYLFYTYTASRLSAYDAYFIITARCLAKNIATLFPTWDILRPWHRHQVVGSDDF